VELQSLKTGGTGGGDQGLFAESIQTDEAHLLGETFHLDVWRDEDQGLVLTVNVGDSLDNSRDYEVAELAALRRRLKAEFTAIDRLIQRYEQLAIGEGGAPGLRAVNN